ncbi:MAG TPA: NTP transferase domain-containing protein [Rhizomicrobium sp.]|nr:NTP transferase domain-containing protein [Rhizomicrobium sp.]
MRRAILDQLVTARRKGRVLVRALDVENGAEKLLDPATDTSALGLAAAAALDDVSRPVTVEGRTWLLTAYNIPWELVIIGAVHIAQALAAMAGPAGYRVRIIDPRAAYATHERFPGVPLQREWPDEALRREPLTPHSALIALAHDPKLDDAALAIALRSPAFHIGALGSTRTHVKRLARLEAQGFSPAELSRISGPVGLPIGARAPAEIAIAILAELVQRRRSKTAGRRIAGIVLAAGMSSRMGRNKLTLPLDGKPLVRHAVEAALAGKLDPILVVTGHDAASMRDALDGLPVRFIHNDAFADGLSTSLRAGIAMVPQGCDGAMVLLGDMPAIDPELIGRLTEAFDPSQSRAICVATAGGERGHPVIWGRQFFAAIDQLRGDVGAKSLMARYPDQVHEVETGDGAPLADIDTPEALAAYAR